ncbi:MAG: CinA family protein [Fulvimarina manganoxydans]|uniref:CinA family protein n=1 Tax=Fulvimarina manganoxydans TaxID=937218 RepID=UPI00235510F7|nr:CinA family protein [Fulvimarina manganoxydans]MCK5931801.1 CinA family protein [Fulvimarina manganoxydans]
MSERSDEIIGLAERLVRHFADKGLMLATVESCTGGLVAGAITEIAGSSAVLDRGFVTYTNEAKMDLVGVDPAALAAHGAVSETVARQMAEGGLSNSRAAVSVAITGIAGPDGGSDAKPVGLVHFACAGPKGIIHRECRFGAIGRQAVREASVIQALQMAIAAN